MGAAADALRFDLSLAPEQMPERFEQAVRAQIDAANLEQLRVVHRLTPLQSAVLHVAAEQAENHAPFEAQTLKRYAQWLKRLGSAAAATPDITNIQQALIALQDKGLMWRAARGVYALEESSLAELLLAEVMPRSKQSKRKVQRKG